VSDVLRLILRRDRRRLPIWVLAIGGLTAVSGRGMVSTFGTQASIDGYAASIQGSAAAIAMTGPPIGLHTMAGVVINKVSSIALVGVVLMVVFEVVRHTRTEEEEGRTELVRSTVVGRHTAAVAALLVACVASLAVGVLVALALLASTAPASAAWVFGGGIAGLGIVFAALTLLLAQVFSRGRTVLGAALAGRREQALVATKVWTPDDAEAERQIERALSYFGGLVDVYQVHNLVAWPKRLVTLEKLRDTHRVRAIGATHYAHTAFPELMDIMRSGRISCVQVPYNALDRVVEQRLLPLAAELDIGVIIMRPLGAGALAARSPRPESRELHRGTGEP